MKFTNTAAIIALLYASGAYALYFHEIKPALEQTGDDGNYTVNEDILRILVHNGLKISTEFKKNLLDIGTSPHSILPPFFKNNSNHKNKIVAGFQIQRLIADENKRIGELFHAGKVAGTLYFHEIEPALEKTGGRFRFYDDKLRSLVNNGLKISFNLRLGLLKANLFYPTEIDFLITSENMRTGELMTTGKAAGSESYDVSFDKIKPAFQEIEVGKYLLIKDELDSLEISSDLRAELLRIGSSPVSRDWIMILIETENERTRELKKNREILGTA